MEVVRNSARRAGRGLGHVASALILLAWVGGAVLLVWVFIDSTHPSRAHAKPPATHITQTWGPTTQLKASLSAKPLSPAKLRAAELRACSYIEFNREQRQYPALWNQCRVDFPVLNYPAP